MRINTGDPRELLGHVLDLVHAQKMPAILLKRLLLFLRADPVSILYCSLLEGIHQLWYLVY